MNILAYIKKSHLLNLQETPTKPVEKELKRSPSASNSGFTLIELIVVVLIIGILSAIIAPSWLAFLNRQRVSKANDAVMSALQNAQSDAKRRKLAYSVSFRTETSTQVPQVLIHLATIDASDTSVDNAWKPLGQGLELKAKQVILCSNISQTPLNQTVSASTCNFTGSRTISFDYQGNLNGTDPKTGLSITLAVPQINNFSQPIDSTKRCVRMTTLLGSMRTGKGQLGTNNPQGCP